MQNLKHKMQTIWSDAQLKEAKELANKHYEGNFCRMVREAVKHLKKNYERV